MTIDFSSTPGGGPTNSESDSPMFAPTPAWERGKKRRSFSGSASREPEPRSFAADTSDRDPAPVMTGATAGGMASDPTTDSFAAAPSYATRPGHRRSATAPLVIAAGIILVGGLAAAGWYYTKPHAQGVAELTPGSATTTTATATTAGAPLPGEQVAQNTVPPAAAPEAVPPEAAPPVAPSRSMTTTTTTTHKAGPTVTHRTKTTVARARTATPSAADVGADAATRAPAQAAPTPTAPPLVLNLPSASQPAPVQTTPAPAPTQTPPAETPPQ